MENFTRQTHIANWQIAQAASHFQLNYAATMSQLRVDAATAPRNLCAAWKYYYCAVEAAKRHGHVLPDLPTILESMLSIPELPSVPTTLELLVPFEGDWVASTSTLAPPAALVPTPCVPASESPIQGPLSLED